MPIPKALQEILHILSCCILILVEQHKIFHHFISESQASDLWRVHDVLCIGFLADE